MRIIDIKCVYFYDLILKLFVQWVCFVFHFFAAFFFPFLFAIVPRYNWNITESGVKHHNSYPR